MKNTNDTNQMEAIVAATSIAGLNVKGMEVSTDSAKVITDKLMAVGHDADSSVVKDMDLMLESAAAHIGDQKVSTEYVDNAEQYNPVSLTIGAASALNMLDTPLKTWAPSKVLPYNKREITFVLPHISISTVKNGRLVKGVNIVDLDIDDIEEEEEAKIIVTLDDESLVYLDEDSARGPEATGKTASLLAGKLIPLLEVSRQRDLSNAELGHTDILRPAGKVTGLNIKVGAGEILRIDTSDVISMGNYFEGNSSGDVKYEKLQADFTLVLSSTTKMLADGEGIRTGVRVACPKLAAIPVGELLVVKVTVDCEVDLKAPSVKMITNRFELVKSVVAGTDVEIDPASAVAGLTFEVVSFDSENLLTNTNHRHLGSFITDDTNKYPFSTRQRKAVSSEFPTLAKDRTADSKSTFTTLKRQAYINDTRMTRFYIGELEKQFLLMKSSIAANLPMNMPNENNFRTTVVEATHTITSIDVMRTSENLEVAKVSLQHTIEAVAKEMVEKSGWKRSINLFGVTGYKVKILAEEKLNLDSFTMTNGIFVEVTKTEYVKGVMWASLEANGGPIVEGVKLLQLSNMLTNASTTYSATRTDGAATTAYMTNVPYYDVVWKLNILAKITVN